MNVTTYASTLESTTGPPADKEYAVDPVGVETISPSPLKERRGVESTAS
jgi:hypothetical protein